MRIACLAAEICARRSCLAFLLGVWNNEERSTNINSVSWIFAREEPAILSLIACAT